MDKLRAMKTFCRVVEAKSFAGAAQSLDVVPSAISKVVAALEQDLGFRLLNRSTRGLALTDDGTAYFERCRQILNDLDEAEAQGRGGQDRARGTLRVGMHPGLRFEAMTHLGPFLDAHPELQVETVITNSPSAVIEDGLDLVLHVGRLADSGLVARPLGWTRSVVCASPAYLSAWGEPTHPSELARHRAVIYARRDEEANTRWAFVRGADTCEVDVPVRTISRDGIGLVDAALGGCGLARPLEIAVRHWLANGRLRAVLPGWEGPPQAVTAVLPARGRSASAKVRLFLEHAAGLLAGEGPK